MAGLPSFIVDAVSKSIRSSMDKFDNIHFNIHTRLMKDIEHVALSGESHLVISSYANEKPEHCRSTFERVLCGSFIVVSHIR